MDAEYVLLEKKFSRVFLPEKNLLLEIDEDGWIIAVETTYPDGKMFRIPLGCLVLLKKEITKRDYGYVVSIEDPRKEEYSSGNFLTVVIKAIGLNPEITIIVIGINHIDQVALRKLRYDAKTEFGIHR